MTKTKWIKSCYFKDCNEDVEKSPLLKFHRFPKNTDLCTNWINACESDKLKSLTFPTIKRFCYVCENHFTNYDYNKVLSPFKCHLKSGIVPKSLPSSLVATHSPLERQVASPVESHEVQYKVNTHQYTPKIKKVCTVASPIESHEVQYKVNTNQYTLKKKEVCTVFHLEDTKSKIERLTEEGITLAESNRFWEAIGRWNCAIALDSSKYKIHDMIAQAYLKVGEVYPALGASKIAVALAPHWWPGHQTHGRTLLNLGEVKMAIKAFAVAIHLKPDEKELWQDDLKWAVSLLHQHKILEDSEKPKPDEELPRIEEFSEEILEECQSTLDSANKDEHCVDPSSNQSEGSEIDKNKPKRTLQNVITCTNKKAKKDDRFDKPVVAFDSNNSVFPSSRSKFDVNRMVCYRS